MPRYKAKVKFTFTGEISLNAPDAEIAKKMINDQFSLTLGRGIHETMDHKTRCEWDFDVHPDKQILLIKQDK